jgi:predicted component of type VI protein secretion system
LHGQFRELLHEYKKQAFRVEHDRQSVEQIASECVQIADEVLQQKYNYHFHRLPDANRAEIINMISNYTREAILPPVVQNLVRRQVTLEKRMDALAGLVEKALEALSTEPNGKDTTRGRS